MLCQNLEAYFDTSLKVYKNLAFFGGMYTRFGRQKGKSKIN